MEPGCFRETPSCGCDPGRRYLPGTVVEVLVEVVVEVVAGWVGSHRSASGSEYSLTPESQTPRSPTALGS